MRKKYCKSFALIIFKILFYVVIIKDEMKVIKFIIIFNVDLKKQFESPPYSVSVEAGHSTELRCIPPTGVPSPRVYWLRNGLPISTSGNEADAALLVSSEGHLLLGQAKIIHQANYTCVAENIAAKRLSAPASITVYGQSQIILGYIFKLHTHRRIYKIYKYKYTHGEIPTIIYI